MERHLHVDCHDLFFAERERKKNNSGKGGKRAKQNGSIRKTLETRSQLSQVTNFEFFFLR